MDGMDDIVNEFIVQNNGNPDQLDRDLVSYEKDPASNDLPSGIFHAILKHSRSVRAAFIFVGLALTVGCGFVGSGSNSSLPKDTAAEPDTISPNPQDWYIRYSNDVGPHPSTDPEGDWSFEFPTWSSNNLIQGHVNYVETPFDATKTPSVVTITFKVESTAPKYRVFGDTLPATFRLFFEQKGDNMSNADGRWWAGSSRYDLGSAPNQVHVTSVLLTPDKWTNVYGKQDPNAFAAALANVGYFGLTFGGQSFAGHGVALAGGTSKFILINYEVN